MLPNIMLKSEVHLFQFTDYRKYLAWYYDYKKANTRGFSYRAFALKAGLKSSGFYIDLVKGNKNLSSKMAASFATAMGLKNKEVSYFLAMVEYNHATTEASQKEWFARMALYLPKELKTIRLSQQEYYRKWFYVAIREALSVLEVKDDYSELSQFLTPPLTTQQTKDAILLLQNLNLVHKIEGRWLPCDSIVSSTLEIDSTLVRSFQSEMMTRAQEALVHIQPDKRNISCTTFSVSEKTAAQIREKMDLFRSELLDLVRLDDQEDRVMQLNLQFFPLGVKP
jgi:uncharacterized protein (TIGR02147 family)